MLVSIELYAPLIYFAAALPYVWMGLYAWKKRPAVAVTPFAWMMLCFSVWSAAYGLEILLPSPSAKLTAALVSYFGIAPIPATLAFFALELTGRNHLLSRRARAALLSVPLAFWILAWTNRYHFLIWNAAEVFKFNNLSILVLQYGAAYWLISFFWLSMIAGAIFLLAAESIQHPKRDGAQVNLMILGLLPPVVSRILYLTRMDFVAYLDFTPLLALPFSLTLSWAITRRYRPQGVIPLEYLNVLKNMTDAALILNERQRVVYLNPAAEILLGANVLEAIGQPIQYVCAAKGEEIAARVSARQARSEIILETGGQSRAFEMTVSNVDASILPRNSDETLHMALLHDITERKAAETVLSRRESVMSALRLAAEQFLKESFWEHHIPDALKKLGEAADLSRVFIAMNYFNRTGALYTSLCYEWAAEPNAKQIGNPTLQHMDMKKAGMGRWSAAFEKGEMIVGHTRDFPIGERKLLGEIGSLSVAAAPIFVGKKWWGFVMFDETRREREWTNIELEALSIAASLFGSAEERARTELNLLRRQQSLDVLHQIVLASLQAEDLLSMSQALVEKFAPLIRADRCALALWDDSSKQEVQLATFDRHERKHQMLVTSPADLTFTELALNNGEPLVVEDADESFYKERHITQILSAKSILALPLMAGKKKLGAVILSFEQPRAFQADEIAICEQAANLVALALEKFQTMEEAERRAAASEKLRKASAAIAETLETEETVARALEELKQVVPYDSASVQLLENGALKIVGGRGFADPKAVIGMTFPVPGDNPNTEVIQSGKPRIFREISKAYEIFKYPPHNHIRSWLGAPLVFQERVIGLLAIDSLEPNHFTEKDLEIAVAFANQVAAALENARLFKETQAQALTDPLTGAYNRRGMFQIGDMELARARRLSRPFSVMMFDIDHFKKINDQYGHPIGDEILRGLAERCRSHLRAADVLCRYGGEEFIVFLPETHLEMAQVTAERMRRETMEAPFPTAAGALPVTVSVGVAQAGEHETLKNLIERADFALYAAKRGGRNRVALSAGESHSSSQT